MKRIAACALMSILLMVSCSKAPEDIVIAQVKDRVITVAEYEKHYAAVDERYLPATKDFNGKMEFLQTLINKEVMGAKADELGYDKDEYVQQGMEAFKGAGLQAAYLKAKIVDKINVDDKALQEYYENWGVTLQVKQILLDTKEEALEVHQMLKDGADFETVCKQYSKGPDAAEGGRVVAAQYGTFPPIFQDELFGTKVGDFTEPILSQYGYFIIKVVGRNQAKKDPLDEIRPQIVKLVENRQTVLLSDEMSEAVRQKYGFQFYEDNIKIAFDALPADRPLTNPPDRTEEVYPLLMFDKQDLDKPLVSYLDKQITIKDFADIYDRANFFDRPRRETRLGGIKGLLMKRAMNELIEVELSESGIENEPEVMAMLQRKREQFMVDKLYRDLIDDQTEVTTPEIREYYENNLEQFRQDEQRRFGVVVLADQQTALEVRQKIVDGEDINDLSDKYAVDTIYKRQGAETDFLQRGGNADIDAYGWELAVGELSEPFESANGWMVLKLLERRPQRILPMSEAAGQISHYLKQQKNEERLKTLLEKWRDEMAVQVNEKNLRKVNLDVRSTRPTRIFG